MTYAKECDLQPGDKHRLSLMIKMYEFTYMFSCPIIKTTKMKEAT